MPPKVRPAVLLDAALIQRVREWLAADRPLRERLQPRGRIVIERQLPFLWVHRTPDERPDDAAASLIRGDACFVEAPAGADGLTRELVAAIAEALSSRFGGLLLLELWAGPAHAVTPGATPGPAGFRICCDPEFARRSTLRRLMRSLQGVVLYQQTAEVRLDMEQRIAPAGAEPLLSPERARALNVALLGLEVKPVYRDAVTGAVYPISRRNLHRQVGQALRRTAFEYSRRETRHQVGHFHAFGRRFFTRQVREVDEAITAVSQTFDLLLSTTPINGEAAFRAFEETRFERTPVFLYRPTEIDPPLLKRELYRIPLERITDPTLSFLFEEKRRELDLKLTMVEELHTRRFLPASVALFGTVAPGLVQEAREILARFPAAEATPPPAKIDAAAFAAQAESLLADLRQAAPDLGSRIELRDDVSSLTVSNGNLLIGRSMTFAEDRAEALLQHELGTHVVTHWNGSSQPFSLLSVGLAGYDELQEGLAVFAEYLVGGLNSLRLRTLAGRVIAARSMSDGASFVETFNELTQDYGFGPRAAFTNTMRVHRGGGFVKDSVYLRGLRSVLEFVRKGGRLESLLVGKVATDHAPLIEELQQREILKPMALAPTYLADPAARARLARARQGLKLEDLVG